MTLKHVILGFLVERPMHGYEIKRAISPAVASSQTVNDGVLYPLLRKMENEGLIAGRSERVGKAPPRTVFKPTKRGTEAFGEWLRSERSEVDEVTYDFLLGHPFLAKCLFFERLTPTLAKQKFEQQLESSNAKLREFGRIRKGMVERRVDRHRIAVLDLGIAQQRAKVQWLKKQLNTSDVDKRLAAGQRGRGKQRKAA